MPSITTVNPRCLAVSRTETNVWHDIWPTRITSSDRPAAGWRAESCWWAHGPGGGEPLLFHVFLEMISNGRYVFILGRFGLCWFSQGLVLDSFVDGEGLNWIIISFSTQKTLDLGNQPTDCITRQGNQGRETLFWKFVRGRAVCISSAAPDAELLNNQQFLNNDDVHLWHRGTNNVSVSAAGLHTCFLETNVLISCMECKEWIQLTHWRTERQRFWLRGEENLSVSLHRFGLFLTVMGLKPKRNSWLNQGMVDNSIKLSDRSKQGRGPSWSSNQPSKKKKSSPPHLPLVGGRVCLVLKV